MALPWRDPQFWLVSGAAVVGLAFVLRRVVRVRRKGEVSMPCENCPSAAPAAPPRWLRRLRGKSAVRLLVAALTLGGAAAPSSPTVADPLDPLERRVAAMGTTLVVRIAAPDRAAELALSELAVEAVAETERRLSTWRDDSELARFNAAAAGSIVELSPPTAAALDVALQCEAESGGAFDPTIAPLVAAWGLRTGGRLPGDAEISAAKARLAASALGIDRAALRRRQPGGVQIEEGGFGKGAALDAALDRVAAASPGAVIELDFGGHLAWNGRRTPTVVRLADPRDRERAVLELVIDAARGSLSTSGNGERAVVAGGIRVGHLLDPRTGRPAPDFGTATVFASSATVADCRSTALFVLGPDQGRRWLTERFRGDGVGREGALLVIEKGALRAILTPGLAAGARALSGDVVIEVLSSVS